MMVGNLVGLILSPLLLLSYGWRGLFYVFGLLGLPLLLFWLKVVPDSPTVRAETGGQQTSLAGAAAASGKASPAEVGTGEAMEATVPPSVGSDVSIARMLSSSATWAIVVVNVVNHFGYFIYLNWMPTYFNKVRWGGPEAAPRVMPGFNAGV